MNTHKFNQIVNSTSDETKEYVRFSMDILDRLNELLEEKFEGKQSLLAKKLGKSESEISKWFSGVQNFTIKTLVKLQLALDSPIAVICTSDDNNSTFEQVRPFKSSQLITSWEVSNEGELEERNAEYTNVAMRIASDANEYELI